MCMRKMMFTLKRNLHREILDQCSICIFVGQIWKKDIGSIAEKQWKKKNWKTFVAPVNTHFQTSNQCALYIGPMHKQSQQIEKQI